MGHILGLKTVDAKMRSYLGFPWPESGEVVAPDWDPEPVCGGGLHFFPWGEGDGNLASWSPDAKWLVLSVEEDDCVNLDGKWKAPRVEVVHCGDRLTATAYLAANGGHGRSIVGGTATAGDRGTATAGDRGTATAGDRGTATAGDRGTATAGYRGTATAGDRGTATAGDRGTATAGYRGTATAGDAGTATAGYRGTATAGDAGTATAGYRGTATAGDVGTATAGDAGTATAGYRGTATAGDVGTATAGDAGTATAGDRGTATAGDAGTLIVSWWDSSANRQRKAVGYIGENGLQPNIAYRLNISGEWLPVNSPEALS